MSLEAKKQGVEKIIAKKSGVDIDSVANILKVATLILIGVLGKQTRENNVSSSNDISGLVGDLLSGCDAQEEQSFLKKILDDDSSIIDDIVGMVLGNANKKSSLGGLLGGLFGKKLNFKIVIKAKHNVWLFFLWFYSLISRTHSLSFY
jgi:hypothetical protein